MQLDFGVEHLTKTVVAVLTGLFPIVVCKYFKGGRQKRVKTLITEEKAPELLKRISTVFYQLMKGRNILVLIQMKYNLSC